MGDEPSMTLWGRIGQAYSRAAFRHRDNVLGVGLMLAFAITIGALTGAFINERIVGASFVFWVCATLSTLIAIIGLRIEALERRRAQLFLVRYVQEMRAYVVDNIEPLHQAVAGLAQVHTPKPPEVVPDAANGADEQPILNRERTSLLLMIAVLCKEAGVDISRHAKSAAALKSRADEMGLTIGESTIEGHLKKVRDAVEARTR